MLKYFPLWPDQASTFAGNVDALYAFLVLMSAVLFVLISATAITFSVVYRRRPGVEATPIEGSTILELTWSVIPFLVMMVIFVWGAVIFFEERTPPRDAVELYAVAKQWMWKFEHPEGQREINELHVPMGRNIKIIMTSQDVIHSLYLPAMRIKQDVLPGRYTTLWFNATKAGEYHLFCAEYCGLNHSAMIGNIVVMETREYDAWMDDVKRNTYASRIDMNPGMSEKQATMITQGAKLALEKGCARCHSIDEANTLLPPTLGPSWVGLYRSERKLADGSTVIADEAYLTRSMMDPMVQLVQGYPPLMPSYQGLLQSGEAAAIAEYIKTLKKDSPTKLGAR